MRADFLCLHCSPNAVGDNTWAYFGSLVLISYEPWSKVAILGMVIQPLIGNPYNGYITPYYCVDDHPLLYGNNGSLDPGTYSKSQSFQVYRFLGPPSLQDQPVLLTSFHLCNIQIRFVYIIYLFETFHF